jgi:hypothetical protein
MKTKPLLPLQPVTQKGDAPSRDLVEIINALHRAVLDLQQRVEALEP